MESTAIYYSLFIAFLAVTSPAWGSNQRYPSKVHDLVRRRLYDQRVSSWEASGAWGSWTSWSPCSRSCGGGVATQTRECLRVPLDSRERNRRRIEKHSSKSNHLPSSSPSPPDSRNAATPPRTHCVGLYRRYHLCNRHPCPRGSPDFRREQCEAFNTRPFKGRFYFWEPFFNGRDPCVLNCRPNGQRFYATLNNTVIDGTTCQPNDDSQICVGGMCKRVGCDGVIGSERQVDVCGICGGDNSTCRVVSGIFTRPQLPVGYNLIAQIPQAACNITVTELKSSRNYLALRKTDGSYILNGNWAINWSGEFEALGTRFTYRRQEETTGEIITAKGPLEEPVDLMIIYQQPNPGIKYEYMLPAAASQNRGGPANGEGQADHGNLLHRRLGDEVAPAAAAAPSAPISYGQDYLTADSRMVTSFPRPNDSALDARRRSNNHRGRRKNDRKFEWKVTEFTECSKSCGGGVQMTVVVCVKDATQTPVHDRKCRLEERPQPQTMRCNLKPCPAMWAAGDWSQCSATCGEGIQMREVFCQQEISPTLTMRVADGACLGPMLLQRTRKCYTPCSKWAAGEWSKCSSACGKGLRARSVKCISAEGKEANWDLCPQGDRPQENEVCDMGSCSANTWFFTEWSAQCSEDCGTGVQTRRIHCSTDVKDETTSGGCDISSKPTTTRTCSSDRQCKGKWFTGPWGQCSTTCGPGRQTRDLMCVTFSQGQYHVEPDANCNSISRPDVQRSCDLKPCLGEWYMSEWGECSRTCGTGVQRREVKCLNSNQTVSLSCPEKEKPPSRQSCNTHHCLDPAKDNFVAEHPDVQKEAQHPAAKNDHSVHKEHSGKLKEDNNISKENDCEDNFRNCHLVVQARLCRYKYYRTSCCNSCRRNKN